jgi:hypothetical protein
MGRTAALARRGSTMSRIAVGLKSAEGGLILLFLRCNSTLREPAIDDRVIKNTQQLAIQEGVTATTAAIPTKKGRRRQGAWQGNNEVEEGNDQGACNHRLDATNARAKEAAQRKLKKDTVDALQLPG